MNRENSQIGSQGGKIHHPQYFECNHMLTCINSHITTFSFSNYGKCVVLVSEFMPNVPEFMPNVSK